MYCQRSRKEGRIWGLPSDLLSRQMLEEVCFSHGLPSMHEVGGQARGPLNLHLLVVGSTFTLLTIASKEQKVNLGAPLSKSWSSRKRSQYTRTYAKVSHCTPCLGP